MNSSTKAMNSILSRVRQTGKSTGVALFLAFLGSAFWKLALEPARLYASFTVLAKNVVALEPDAAFAERMSLAKAEGSLPAALDVRVGTIADIHPAEQFDTILYIDVLEHIEDDRGELELAAERLTKGGYIVVLAPAHQALYTAFDAAIGHFRRYDRKSLLNLTPSALQPHYAVYLDSVGLVASIGNRLFLKSATPTVQQILLWDNVMVRA